MATKEALEGLEKTGVALVEIKKQLKPFVDRLETAEGKALAQAQAAVALSVGTLRYMGARLRGLDQGRKADDPLRQELNEMRRVLTAVEKMKDDDAAGSAKKKFKKNEGKQKNIPEKAKTPVKRKAVDKEEPKEASVEKTDKSGEKKHASKQKRPSPSPKKRQRKR